MPLHKWLLLKPWKKGTDTDSAFTSSTTQQCFCGLTAASVLHYTASTVRRLQRLGGKRSWSDRRNITAFNITYREQSHKAPVIIAGAAVNPRTKYTQYRSRAIRPGQPAQYHSLRFRNGLHDTDIRSTDGTERASCECDDSASGWAVGTGFGLRWDYTLRCLQVGNENVNTSLGEAHSCRGRQVLGVYAKQVTKCTDGITWAAIAQSV